MFRTIIIAAALVAMAPAAAFAGSAHTPGQVRVNYADLNLDSDVGVQALFERIKQASADICGPAPSIADLNESRAYQDCMQATISKSVRQMNLPTLTAVSEGLKTVQYASH
jgi:UrcA family protein